MALTSEDLLAISQLLDVKLESILERKLESKLQPIRDDVRIMKNDVRVLKDEVCVLKEDVCVLKEDVRVLKENVRILKEDVRVLKEDVCVLKEDVCALKEDVCVLKNDVRFLKLQNENEILPRLGEIESCYLSSYDRYKTGIVQLDSMQADIDVMKNVIMKHSDKLRQLA